MRRHGDLLQRLCRRPFQADFRRAPPTSSPPDTTDLLLSHGRSDLHRFRPDRPRSTTAGDGARAGDRSADGVLGGDRDGAGAPGSGAVAGAVAPPVRIPEGSGLDPAGDGRFLSSPIIPSRAPTYAEVLVGGAGAAGGGGAAEGQGLGMGGAGCCGARCGSASGGGRGLERDGSGDRVCRGRCGLVGDGRGARGEGESAAVLSLFRTMMDPEEGIITPASLKRGSALIGLGEIPDADIAATVQEHDKDGDGGWCVAEFMQHLEALGILEAMFELDVMVSKDLSHGTCGVGESSDVPRSQEGEEEPVSDDLDMDQDGGQGDDSVELSIAAGDEGYHWEESQTEVVNTLGMRRNRSRSRRRRNAGRGRGSRTGRRWELAEYTVDAPGNSMHVSMVRPSRPGPPVLESCWGQGASGGTLLRWVGIKAVPEIMHNVSEGSREKMFDGLEGTLGSGFGNTNREGKFGRDADRDVMRLQQMPAIGKMGLGRPPDWLQLRWMLADHGGGGWAADLAHADYTRGYHTMAEGFSHSGGLTDQVFSNFKHNGQLAIFGLFHIAPLLMTWQLGVASPDIQVRYNTIHIDSPHFGPLPPLYPHDLSFREGSPPLAWPHSFPPPSPPSPIPG